MKAFREITPLANDDVFVLLDSVNNGFDYPLHHHPEYELTLITGSSGTRIVGDSVEKYTDWDLVLVGPYLVHKWDGDDKPTEDQQPCRVLTLQFGMHDFDHAFFSKTSFFKLKQLLQASSRGIAFDATTFEKAKELLIELTYQSDMASVIIFFQLLDWLSQATDVRYLSSEGYTEEAILNSGTRLKIVNDYILQHFSNPKLRISDVARQVNLTRSAFSHFFKKSTNRSFTEFVLDIRLGYAGKLLINSDAQIGNIAFESGFHNLTNFNRAFKKHFGTTPKNFRKIYQDKNQFDALNQRTPGQFLPQSSPVERAMAPRQYATRIRHG